MKALRIFKNQLIGIILKKVYDSLGGGQQQGVSWIKP